MMNAIARSNWIVCPRPNPQAKLRLFCFHYAGGRAISFRNWSDSLPSDVEVCAIELPGRGTRFKEQPFTQMQPLIRALATALLPNLNKPFAFFGHSMGALLGFELARWLSKNHHLVPMHLFVSGDRAPQLLDLDPPIHTLPESDFLAELRRYNGTPAAVLNNAELMQLLLPTLRADFAVLETYSYTASAPLDCPIAAFGGLQDSKVSVKDLEAWREQTSATFSLQMLAGDHFFLDSSRLLLLHYLSQHLLGIVSS